MLQAHQQITDETGITYILVPLEEYNSLMGNHPEDNNKLEQLADASEIALIAERRLEPKRPIADLLREL
jgi:hypothetical protein